MFKIPLSDFPAKLEIFEDIENVLICLFLLGSWQKSYYIMRPILAYTKRKKEFKKKKKKKEGNKVGKETERQTDIQTYCPIVEFVFMLF